MKLYTNPASPFARKVRVVARELDLVRLVEEINVDRRDLGDGFRHVNPLGKIPVLVLKDSSTLVDSPVICEYLNELGGGALFPSANDPRLAPLRWRALTLQALGDGVCDAAVARNLEVLRPPELQSEAMIQRHLHAVASSLDILERGGFAEPWTIGEIAVACALGYLDFRIPEFSWRDGRPKLRNWYEKVAQTPSMKDTWPAALA
jgi:glutathione S-transferase